MIFSADVESNIDMALREDGARGDVTSDALLPRGLEGRAKILVKEAGVLAGMAVADTVFTKVDPGLKMTTLIADGSPVKPGDVAGEVSGSAASILRAERVALNYLQHLSGIASITSAYVARVRGLNARIVDTRKTIPGLRELEKYAVRMGGGHNHRMHLGDRVLIKDNHLAILRREGLSLEDIVRKARQNAPDGIEIEVEVTSLDEARAAAGADTIMLDNMPPEEMRRVVDILGGKVKLEASGGINLETVRAVAETGVDIISVGALTHSVKALDISLDLEV
jgi:nicotinate-nucleotide pyrophosphorylase (carboxylating)